jgi:acetyl esterase/lipase
MSFKHLTAGLVLVASMAVNPLAMSQSITDPQLLSAYEEIRAMGPNMGPEVVQRTGELFAELHRHTPKDGVNATRDLQYGPDAERHLLDVYTPVAAGGSRPAVVFIHGGGLTGGFKDNAASDLMYANIGTYFARHGMVGINATYRLVPDIVYPQGAEDMTMIVSGFVKTPPITALTRNRYFLSAPQPAAHMSARCYLILP